MVLPFTSALPGTAKPPTSKPKPPPRPSPPTKKSTTDGVGHNSDASNLLGGGAGGWEQVAYQSGLKSVDFQTGQTIADLDRRINQISDTSNQLSRNQEWQFADEDRANLQGDKWHEISQRHLMNDYTQQLGDITEAENTALLQASQTDDLLLNQAAGLQAAGRDIRATQSHQKAAAVFEADLQAQERGATYQDWLQGKDLEDAFLNEWKNYNEQKLEREEATDYAFGQSKTVGEAASFARDIAEQRGDINFAYSQATRQSELDRNIESGKYGRDLANLQARLTQTGKNIDFYANQDYARNQRDLATVGLRRGHVAATLANQQAIYARDRADAQLDYNQANEIQLQQDLFRRQNYLESVGRRGDLRQDLAKDEARRRGDLEFLKTQAWERSAHEKDVLKDQRDINVERQKAEDWRFILGQSDTDLARALKSGGLPKRLRAEVVKMLGIQDIR